ncbi:MAG: hypothetical protein JWP21_3253 [Tardiphaga sp.]|nr:hypothetical protein [Tardiphaga sp.]
MTRWIALAGIVATAFAAATAAQAQDRYRFNIDGQAIRIDQPRNCHSSDCVSVSIPGYYERDGRRSRRAKKAERDRLAKAKAAAQSNTEAKGDLKAEPTSGVKDEPKNDSRLSSQPSTDTPAAAPAAKVAAVPSSRALAPKRPNASPLGIWLTEETNGKVRIEPCGDNLCGYAIDPKSGDKADKVLIDMVANGPKWTGRIFDPGNGNNFDSSIALSGPDSLRVQGCPTNATFCGSQTWTRIN